jgi:hypothetical protein
MIENQLFFFFFCIKLNRGCSKTSVFWKISFACQTAFIIEDREETGKDGVLAGFLKAFFTGPQVCAANFEFEKGSILKLFKKGRN